jgi:hypothetical protein
MQDIGKVNLFATCDNTTRRHNPENFDLNYLLDIKCLNDHSDGQEATVRLSEKANH